MPTNEEMKEGLAGQSIAELQKKKKLSAKTKPKSARDPNAFNLYIYRVLKQVCSEKEEQVGISQKAMVTMNSIIADTFDEIMGECRNLVINGKKHTLQSRDVEAAVKLLLTGELKKHAVDYGQKGLKDHMGDAGDQ